MGKTDPQNNLECKFVHQNQNLFVIHVDPLTPHNASPGHETNISSPNNFGDNEHATVSLICFVLFFNM